MYRWEGSLATSCSKRKRYRRSGAGAFQLYMYITRYFLDICYVFFTNASSTLSITPALQFWSEPSLGDYLTVAVWETRRVSNLSISYGLIFEVIRNSGSLNKLYEYKVWYIRHTTTGPLFLLTTFLYHIRQLLFPLHMRWSALRKRCRI